MLALLRKKVISSRPVLICGRCQWPGLVQLCSTSATSEKNNYLSFGTSDPGPLFLNEDTQRLLKSLTRLDVSRIFRKRSVKENTLQFKFMTTEQIQEEVENALRRAEFKLQMPPIMKIKEEKIELVSQDPALEHFADSDYVFTDITFGIPDTDRTMITRKLDGTLSTASLEVRKRLNQFYFPLNGRQVRVPRLFDTDNLKQLMENDEFEFILDAMCIQFEPYERQFHEISALVYEHINEHKKFEALRSTRHFGPMSFFLAWHNVVDNLLLDLITNDYLDNCIDLIELTCKLNKWSGANADKLNSFRKLASSHSQTTEHLASIGPSVVATDIEQSVGKTAEQIESDAIAMDIIRQFVQEHSIKKVQLELMVQTYVERAEQQRKLVHGIQIAHGLNK